MIMKKPSIVQMQTLLEILSSVISVGVLVFSLLALNAVVWVDAKFATYFALSFMFLALSKIPLIFKGQFHDKSLIAFIKNILFFVTYTIFVILIFCFPNNYTFYCIICSLYFLTVTINRVCRCFEHKSVPSYIYNSIIALFGLLIGVSTLSLLGQPEEYILSMMLMCILVIMILSLVDILVFSFSRMKLRGIMKIMRRTYAFEILYGLVVLIIASSFYFSIMEEGIPSFADGLWYSFAVVTTIGFGDFTVTSVVGRILSVLLGIYGLVVVAVITSVIVNFYNESKDKKKDIDSKEDKPEEEKDKE